MKVCLASPVAVLALLGLVASPETSPRGQETGLRLAGEFLIPPKTPFRGIGPSSFGAISGLTTLPGGCELLAISDDHQDPRMYRLALSGSGASTRVRPVRHIPLGTAAGAPATLDPEGIALTKGGTVLISTEGMGNDPRLPPAILEYTQDGRFLRQLQVPPRFLPNERGPQRSGSRRNSGFESLAMAADGSRFYTASELPLVQDGPDAPFTPGRRIRIIEYVADGTSYAPGREFAYELAPLDEPAAPYGQAISGLVELLPLGPTELLALERGFVQAKGVPFGVNTIRLFRISLDGAMDVSTIDALGGRADVKPVEKTLVQDFSALRGRSLRLLNLENFEGMAWVGPGGQRSLLVVSDDNFNALQVTAFLLLEYLQDGRGPAGCP
jgi:hypothetical protein